MTDQALCAAPVDVDLADAGRDGGLHPLPQVSAGDAEVVLAKADRENFPVASRLLPARYRRHLLALYGFARLVDDAGDSLPEQGYAPGAVAARLALLDELEDDLGRALSPGGWPHHPLVRDLAASIVELDLPAQPLRDLIAANRQDQVVSRYATFDDLLAYCRLSANPVGRLVLAVFGSTDPADVALSDRVCTALQLIEHCQDVAEDVRRGRVYLPLADLRHFRCDEADLAARPTPPPVRALIAYECHRARSLLAAGAPLVGRLRGPARLAVAGFVAGGRAALDGLAAVDFDVSDGPPLRSPARLARHLAVLAVRGR